MATDITIDLATLRFDGERFEGHALDVECTQELITYRNLIVECAKELWRRKHPDRINLPKGFEKGFRLQFNRLEDGSAKIPLQRVCMDDQSNLDWGNLDEFDEAADLIDAAITAANDDQLLPDALPTNVIPLFRDFGKTLGDDEVLFTRSRHGLAEAPYTAKARKRLTEWVMSSYEDTVDVIGEVRMANVGQGSFSLQLDGVETVVSGRFSPEQEAEVLEALRNHRALRLRVIGMAEFATSDRQIKRFIRVNDVMHTVLVDQVFDETAVPIWEQLSAIGESAPEGTWDSVPTDLSIKIDDLVYRHDSGVR